MSSSSDSALPACDSTLVDRIDSDPLLPSDTVVSASPASPKILSATLVQYMSSPSDDGSISDLAVPPVKDCDDSIIIVNNAESQLQSVSHIISPVSPPLPSISDTSTVSNGALTIVDTSVGDTVEFVQLAHTSTDDTSTSAAISTISCTDPSTPSVVDSSTSTAHVTATSTVPVSAVSTAPVSAASTAPVSAAPFLSSPSHPASISDSEPHICPVKCDVNASSTLFAPVPAVSLPSSLPPLSNADDSVSSVPQPESIRPPALRVLPHQNTLLSSTTSHVEPVLDSDNNPFLAGDQAERPFVLKYHRTPEIESFLASSSFDSSMDKRKSPFVDESDLPSSKRMRSSSLSHQSFTLPATPPLLIVNGIRFVPEASSASLGTSLANNPNVSMVSIPPVAIPSTPLTSTFSSPTSNISAASHIVVDEYAHLDIDLPNNLDDIPGLELPASSRSLSHAGSQPLSSSLIPSFSHSTPQSKNRVGPFASHSRSSLSTPQSKPSGGPFASHSLSSPTTPRSKKVVGPFASCPSSASSNYRDSSVSSPSPSRLASPLPLSSPLSSPTRQSPAKDIRSPASARRLSLINLALQEINVKTPRSSMDPMRSSGSAQRLSIINSALQELGDTTPTPSLDDTSVSSLNLTVPAQQDSTVFDDRGLGASGALQLHLIELPLRGSYTDVINLRYYYLGPILKVLSDCVSSSPMLRPIALDSVPCEDEDYLSISSTLASLQLHERRALLSSALFVHVGGWFNPARADPSYIKTVSNDKGVTTMSPVLNSWSPAMCLSVGIVQQCSIVQPVTTTLNNGSERTTREAHIIGFSQEEQRKFAFLANVLNFKTASIPASAGVVVYSSMPQRFDSGAHRSSQSSTQFNRLPRRQRPARFASDDPRLGPKLYPQFRLPSPFNTQIPIFDGRRSSDTAFECEANDLHEMAINSYPLYQNGDVDLPPGSLVTVGYTVHTYPPKSGEGPICLSFDIAFLVLMALPANLPSRYYNTPLPAQSPQSLHLSPPHSQPSTSSNPPTVTRHYIDLTTLSTGEPPYE
ncbi:hypothetical protein EV361DRAFT_871627 [Lentinula raphanica]|nr:hypothetical protein EV361DRAFT_871627 [Lentinula raphanica]